MIPRGEQAHWDDAVAEISEPALGTDIPGPAPEQHPDNERLHERLVGQAREIRAVCPDVWEVLDVMTRPRAHECWMMQPSMPMTSGERMAYHLGLDAVGQWLRSLADSELPQEREAQHEGESDG